MKNIYNPKLIQLETIHNDINKQKLIIIFIAIILAVILILIQL